jgi:hypothetical protein
LSFASSQNPFKQDNREYPVDFGFYRKYAVNIVIPEDILLRQFRIYKFNDETILAILNV